MTFSIVLRDPEENSFGIAVATKHFAVGALVPHLRSGVGAVAVQASTNPHLGLSGLEQLASGKNIEQALKTVLAEDPEAGLRQLHGLDASGKSWAWSGKQTKKWAGHQCGENYSVAGNMLTGLEVVETCVESLLKNTDLPLEEKLLKALQAGEQAGGDRRGKQSAALLTVRHQPFTWCNLRVDDHPEPLFELERLFSEFRKPYYQGLVTAIHSKF